MPLGSEADKKLFKGQKSNVKPCVLPGTGIGLEVSTASNDKHHTLHAGDLGSPDFLRPSQQRLSDFSNDSTASGSTSVNDQSSNLFGDSAWPGPDQNQLFSQASIFD